MKILQALLCVFLLIAPYIWKEEILRFNPITLAESPSHWAAQAGRDHYAGVIASLIVAVFFFIFAMIQDRPRMKYVVLAILLFDLLNWFTLWAMLLLFLLIFTGMWKIIFETVGTFNAQANERIPVTPIMSHAEWTAQRNGQLESFWDDSYSNELEKTRGDGRRVAAPEMNLPKAPSISFFKTSPKETTYTSHNGSITVATAKKPIRGIRWFYRNKETGKAESTGMGRKAKRQWDDIGQLRADRKPGPDNDNGIYMFGAIEGFANPTFHAMAAQGMFAAEVEIWGTVIYHPHEDVYRGENGRITKELFSYEEWMSYLRDKYPVNPHSPY